MANDNWESYWWTMDKKELENQVDKAFLHVKGRFPFPGYMDRGLEKCRALSLALASSGCLPGSRILSIGSGPCDCEAVLSRLGYKVTALDDLSDPWHLIGKNRERILRFAEASGVDFILQPFDSYELGDGNYDAALLLDVVEHLHTSPRGLLNRMVSSIRPGGLLVVETPNSTALAKRVWTLLGRSGHMRLDYLFWSIGEYRGHVREYTEPELRTMLEHENLEVVASRMLNLMTDRIEATGNLTGALRAVYDAVSSIYPRFRDTTLMVSRKPEKWMPAPDSIAKFKESYGHLQKYNLDGESDEVLVRKLVSRHRQCEDSREEFEYEH